MAIVFNYAAVAQVEEKINSCHGLLTENLENLRTRLGNLDWDGEDRTAYQANQLEWDKAVSSLIELLPQVRAEVQNASQSFSDNERRGAARWS